MDRQFSYSKIDYQLNQNNQEQAIKPTHEPQQQSIASNIASSVVDGFGTAGSLLGGLTDIPPTEQQQEFDPYKKKKKRKIPKKGISR